MNKKFKGTIKKAAPYIVLIISLLLTFLAWRQYDRNVQQREESRFQHSVNHVINEIVDRIHRYEMVLQGGAGLFAASEEVTRQEWQAYCQYQRTVDLYPGVQGVGFAEVVYADELEEHIKRIRNEGFSRYSVWPEEDRDNYAVIVYLEPFDQINRRAFGFDLLADPVQRSAAEQARDSDAASISAKLTLVQDTDGEKQPGFIMVLPVYSKDLSHHTIDQRRAAIEGYIFAPFRVNDLMNNIFPDPLYAIDFEIYDGSEVSEASLLYDSYIEEEAHKSLFATQTVIDLYGHQWTVQFQSTPHFESSPERFVTLIVLIAGLFFSVLLFLYLRVLERNIGRIRLLNQALQESEEEIRTLNVELEQRVKDRTVELEAVNRELEAFTYSVSHDLRAPLRALDGFSEHLYDSYADQIDEQGRNYLSRIRNAALYMSGLIDDLLKLSRVTRTELKKEQVDLHEIIFAVLNELRETDPDREIAVIVEERLAARGDVHLLRIAFENLLGNAWKFSAKEAQAQIEVGQTKLDGEKVFFVRDNGAGFDMAYAEKLFGAFQRLHGADEFPGSGIGLATVQRIIKRHGGRIWAESEVGEGTTFYFTLPV